MTSTSPFERVDDPASPPKKATPTTAQRKVSSPAPIAIAASQDASIEHLEGNLTVDLTVTPPALLIDGVEHQSLHTRTPPISSRFAVRALDLVVAVPAFLVALPVIVVLMVAVRANSSGSALFASRRITRDGEFFNMWKLRTMVVDGPDVLAAHFLDHPEDEAKFQASMKLEHDPRVTALGRVLRRWSLDELPQLWNVIQGNMSLVGPRPLLAEEAKRMGRAFPTVVRVKGGLTGLWQISGRSSLTFEERVPLDVEYVNDRSLRGDLRILMTTVGQLLKGRPGAF